MMITKVDKKNEKLERALAHLPRIEPSEELISRILSDAESALKQTPKSGLIWPFGKAWQPAVVMALALLLGVYTGFTMTSLEPEDVTAEIESMMG